MKPYDERSNFNFGTNQDLIVSNPTKNRSLGFLEWGYQSYGHGQCQKQDSISKLGFLSEAKSSFSLFKPKASQTTT